MPQQAIRVEVPGHGVVEFPAGTSQAEMKSALMKLPQVDAPRTTPQTPQPAAPSSPRSTLADVAVGAAKGVGNTVVGLGELAYNWIPGVARVSDAINQQSGAGTFDAARANLQPTNTAQNVGFMAEQVGEFFVPGGAVARAARGSRVARAGLEAVTAAPLAAAQGASRTEAGVTGALSAAVPSVAPIVRGTSRALRRGAEKNVAQALGATKEWAKDEATKLAPEIIKRGVGGSREAMLEQATREVDSIGRQISAEIQKAADAGATIEGDAISGYLTSARQKLMVTKPNGAFTPIPGTERVIRRLDRLDEFVGSLGADIPFDKAAKIKQTLDHIVSKAGLYGQKATASATDSAEAWATREAASGFRRLLADGNATLADLNTEFAFWKGLKGVLKETERRTQAQSGGLVSGISGSAGMATGFATGNSTSDKVQNAVLGGLAGRQLVRIFQSPQWRTRVAAPLKDKLADALARNDVGHVTSITGRILSTLPSTAR